jgi:hypothetical protein
MTMRSTPRRVSLLAALALSQAIAQGCGRAKPTGAAITDSPGAAGAGGSAASSAGSPGDAGGTGGAAGAAGGVGGAISEGGGDATNDLAIDLPSEPLPTSPLVDCNANPERCAFCTAEYPTIQVHRAESMRGTWQANPGGAPVMLPVSGYPCAAFLYDGPVRPAADDDHWVGAPNGQFINYSVTSTLPVSDYRYAQFYYFRSLVYVPPGTTISSFRVVVGSVDDSVKLILFNSKYPNGVSPTDAGPSDPAVGACNGNGGASWDFKDYAQAGEINLVLIIHVDLSPTVSSISQSDITVNGQELPLFDCVSGVGPPPDVVEPGADAASDG